MARLLAQGLIIACVVSCVLTQNLSRSELRRLYNTQVRYAQRYERPLGSSGSISNWPTPHAGVVVTTVDGERWLIHKGDGYGRSSQTVVTRASYMSSRWTTRGPRKAIWYSTVGDYVSVGGSDYSLASDNCRHAATRMMDLD